MKVYKSLWKFTKATIFHSIFSFKSLTFVSFSPITKYYCHFVILYHDKQNSSVYYCTVSALGNISKYFAIIKRKVIFSISQILTRDKRSSLLWKFVNHSRKKFYKIVPRSLERENTWCYILNFSALPISPPLLPNLNSTLFWVVSFKKKSLNFPPNCLSKRIGKKFNKTFLHHNLLLLSVS